MLLPCCSTSFCNSVGPRNEEELVRAKANFVGRISTYTIRHPTSQSEYTTAKEYRKIVIVSKQLKQQLM
jgi:dsDNA-specific endonuclease/ATPase MutS2